MLVNLQEIMKFAEEKEIAIGAFNTPCFESLCAVIEMAEYKKIPVIIEHAEVHFPCGPLDQIGPAMVDFARRAKVPVCVHLDHGTSMRVLEQAVELGFTSVMFDGSALSYGENKKQTKKAVEYVHQHGVSLEAELGCMATAGSRQGNYTDPALAADFVSETGIDALAIAFGTAHGIYTQAPVLNFDIINQVKKAADLPLVMHGGSGVDDKDYVKAIKQGIRKINYYSYMGAGAYQKALEYGREHPENSRLFQELSKVAVDTMKGYLDHIMDVFYRLK
ncbi:D-tagatose-1%2C6-bisphosphate aldolase subunit GatY [uncultured Ruminococcus sp.]|nr:D-tagatose-1%2C6-bisphosphate aldolase subunit GatY [uncultured Clostridium sp.]SCH89536.1 D-tagatose-1%2C6-bisphosphate aldolase subunit GatY [uncultured Ruminococcus sp.]